jgi:hypothetical protein
MNAPKKIWVWEYAAEQLDNKNPDSTDVPYIRADLVDGLAQALRAYVNDDWSGQEAEIEAQARAALAKLEEE